MSECLRTIANNTANFAGGHAIGVGLHDILHPHVEEKSAEDIVADVVERGGLTLI